MKYTFLTDLEQFLVAKYPKLGETFVIEYERCPEGMAGDLTVNCFRFAKACGNPMALAAEVADYLKAHPAVADAQPIKAFVNVTLKPAALFADTVADMPRLLKSAKLPDTARERILIEFSAPNTNKPQHLGHVRNNTLGMSLASLLKRVGHDVIEINLVNDRGIHICKSMMAYLLTGNGCTPESTGVKGEKAFEALVKAGEKFEAQARGAIDSNANMLKGRINDATKVVDQGIGTVGDAFDTRIKQALTRLGYRKNVKA